MPKLKSLIGPRSGSDGKKDTSTLYRNITEPVKMNGITFCIVEPNAEIQGLLNILFDFGTKESASQFMNVFITFLLFLLLFLQNRCMLFLKKSNAKRFLMKLRLPS